MEILWTWSVSLFPYFFIFCCSALNFRLSFSCTTELSAVASLPLHQVASVLCPLPALNNSSICFLERARRAAYRRPRSAALYVPSDTRIQQARPCAAGRLMALLPVAALISCDTAVCAPRRWVRVAGRLFCRMLCDVSNLGRRFFYSLSW